MRSTSPAATPASTSSSLMTKYRAGTRSQLDTVHPGRPWGVGRPLAPLRRQGKTTLNPCRPSRGHAPAVADIASAGAMGTGVWEDRRRPRSSRLTLPGAASRSWLGGRRPCGRYGGCRRPGRIAWNRDRSSLDGLARPHHVLAADVGAVVAVVRSASSGSGCCGTADAFTLFERFEAKRDRVELTGLRPSDRPGRIYQRYSANCIV